MNSQKLGVIQALGLGYEAVARALWVIVIPIVLDVFFWLGPRLSLRPLFERLLISMQNAAPLTPDLQPNLDDVRRFISDVGNSFNLFSLLATDFLGFRVLPVPTLKAFELPFADVGSASPLASGDALTLSNVPQIFLLAVVLLTVGLLVGVTYLTLIADRVRAPRDALQPLPRRVLTNWLRMLLFVAALAVFYALMGVPFMIAFGIASLIHVALAIVVLMVGWTLSFWLLLYMLFVAYAIVMDGDTVRRALWHSANVVQRNLLSTFGLLLLGNMITAGMGIIWQQFESNSLGNVVAIVANAFVGSGLVAATFVFYQNRYAVWQMANSELRMARGAVK